MQKILYYFSVSGKVYDFAYCAATEMERHQIIVIFDSFHLTANSKSSKNCKTLETAQLLIFWDFSDLCTCCELKNPRTHEHNCH